MTKPPNGPKHKKPAITQAQYSFEEFDDDLLQLDKIMKKSKIGPLKRFQIIQPLISLIPAAELNTKTPKTNRANCRVSLLLVALAVISLGLFLCYFMSSSTQEWSWHVSGVCRLAMMKMLAIYDWKHLKDEMCLVPKLTNRIPTAANLLLEPDVFDCNLCESAKPLHYLDQKKYEVQYVQEYIKRLIDADLPVIIASGAEHWIKDSPEAFVNQMLVHEEFSQSIPCNLCSNFYSPRREQLDLQGIFQKRTYFDYFFMHFQNCDLDAMRVFRNHTYRPDFLPDELSPVTYNWLIWNRNYEGTGFKKLNLVEKYTAIGQLYGKSMLKLSPRKNCEHLCPEQETVLAPGSLLIVTSLWDVEYWPMGSEDNMAVVLEIRG